MLETVGVDQYVKEQAELDWLVGSNLLGKPHSNVVRVLSYVCGRYFKDPKDEISEYSIAVEALGRRGSFDSQSDTIVRVTMHLLRKRLLEIYCHEGAGRPVAIAIPGGHYAPAFLHRQIDAAEPVSIAQGKPKDGPVRTAVLERERTGESPSGDFDATAGAQGEAARCAELEALSFDPGSVTESSLSHHPPSPAGGDIVIAQKPLVPPPGTDLPAAQHRAFWSKKTGFVWLAVALVFGVGSFIGLRLHTYNAANKILSAQKLVAGSLPVTVPTTPASGLLALVGSSRAGYVDASGRLWQQDRFCAGGSAFHQADDVKVVGTEDAPLFLAGLRGRFQCVYQVPAGTYELHLYFAEIGTVDEATRDVTFTINGDGARNLDVVDEAGGSNNATMKVYTGVRPGADGAIHVDFISPDALLNAIEILPAGSEAMLPIYITTAPHTIRDGAGKLWLSDRYFQGGRRSQLALTHLASQDPTAFSRLGHFQYTIPVSPDQHYSLTLYFREPWFGKANYGIGGKGSRIFDVSCNGTSLLRNFDIFAENGNEVVVKRFHHLTPTAQGKLELRFTPVVNYPIVTAIEVHSEDASRAGA